ncbi:MAG TPA: NAD-dependent epimerase/dehydratase family protein, partial [Candidatus Saccharimonadales bacterium]|nr:NAD-dependent epimerase/dehydratase family protein [Candidatus Saccharimonadales bacterium]
MKILVTGGAGYIGSITVKALQKAGHDVVVFDNLEYGHREAVTVPLIVGDLLQKESLKQLDSYSFDAVVHFAAYLQVAESMENPYKYFENNMMGGLNLLEYMKAKNIPSIVFSSTAAVFGMPEQT